MSKVYIKKEFKFEASHRLLNHPNKCANIHGHNYVVWVYARNKDGKLNDLGMIIDFADLKNGIGKWIDRCWDHALIYNYKDSLIQDMLNGFNFNIYEMNCNPTAENMAQYLLNTCEHLYQDTNVDVFKIEVYENSGSVAIAEKDECTCH